MLLTQMMPTAPQVTVVSQQQQQQQQQQPMQQTRPPPYNRMSQIYDISVYEFRNKYQLSQEMTYVGLYICHC